MSDQKRTPEQELEQHLAGQSELAQIYAGGDEPTTSARLDDKIRQLAREQLQAKNERPAENWFPVSMAAAVLLSVTIVFITHFTGTGPQETLIATDTAPAPSRDSAQPTPRVTQTQQPADEPAAEQTRLAQDPARIQARDSGEEKTAPIEQAGKEPETFELPPHLRDALQPTAAGDAQDRLLPDEILRQWTPQQWSRHIAELTAQGKDSLANLYRERFKVLFPDTELPPAGD